MVFIFNFGGIRGIKVDEGPLVKCGLFYVDLKGATGITISHFLTINLTCYMTNYTNNSLRKTLVKSV